MATNTPNLNLIKPDLTDPVDIGDLNSNMDILDVLGRGYRYVETIYYTSSGTFVKANYPWLKAIRVRLVGGGGGGGGSVATGAGQFNANGGGGGGGYAESFITDIAGLPASIDVTRGAGGAAGTTAGASGGTGGDSVFLTLTGFAGRGGTSLGPGTGLFFGFGGENSSAAGQGSGGDINSPGSPGTLSVGWTPSNNRNWGGSGGNSVLGLGASRNADNGSLPANRTTPGPGGGGAGRALSQNQPAGAGGAGGNGIVIVDLFA
jgi:hypothetical protein